MFSKATYYDLAVRGYISGWCPGKKKNSHLEYDTSTCTGVPPCWMITELWIPPRIIQKTHKLTHICCIQGIRGTVQRPQHQTPTQTHAHTQAYIHTLCSSKGISLVCMQELLQREKSLFCRLWKLLHEDEVCVCVSVCVCACVCVCVSVCVCVCVSVHIWQAVVCWQSVSQRTKSLVKQWLADCVPECQLSLCMCLF